ncbi:MAG: hypothetical protein HQL80_00550 [Magnetococcales bacterium]|nr:hypothetical protein [Magnetococcales bacterium]
MADRTLISVESIRDEIERFVLENFVSDYHPGTLPLDESLVELGILDSYGVVELVAFIEEKWSITILDAEITREKMGSVNKMSRLVLSKITPKE